MEIGIIGFGYVGKAMHSVLSPHYKVRTYDTNGNGSSTKVEDVIKKSEVIFVCVPTPMKKDGSCDTSIVEKVISGINKTAKGKWYNPDSELKIVVIKSTVPPGTTERLNKEYKKKRGVVTVIFNPEFLTERHFLEDIKNPKRIILGGPRPQTSIVKQLYTRVYPTTPIIKTGSNTAEMVKYFINAFLATKVSFANEIYKICEKLDIDYDKVVEYVLYDDRIGKSHLTVPGPDGEFGFGGHCLPKDLNALISVAVENSLGLYINVLSGVLNTNDKVRKNRDWEEMKGRAVVDD